MFVYSDEFAELELNIIDTLMVRSGVLSCIFVFISCGQLIKLIN